MGVPVVFFYVADKNLASHVLPMIINLSVPRWSAAARLAIFRMNEVLYAGWHTYLIGFLSVSRVG